MLRKELDDAREMVRRFRYRETLENTRAIGVIVEAKVSEYASFTRPAGAVQLSLFRVEGLHEENIGIAGLTGKQLRRLADLRDLFDRWEQNEVGWPEEPLADQRVEP